MDTPMSDAPPPTKTASVSGIEAVQSSSSAREPHAAECGFKAKLRRLKQLFDFGNRQRGQNGQEASSLEHQPVGQKSASHLSHSVGDDYEHSPMEVDSSEDELSSSMSDIADAEKPDYRFREAFEALVQGGIVLIEHGYQVKIRYGYHEPPDIIEWIIPDEQVATASNILTNAGWPLSSRGSRGWLGSWEEACTRHAMDKTTAWSCVYLIPLSLTGLSLNDTYASTSYLNDNLPILTPKPPQYMASLIRFLRKFASGGTCRFRVEEELLVFISSYLLQEDIDYDPINRHESLLEHLADDELEVILAAAVRVLEAWDWSNVDKVDRELADKVVLDCAFVELVGTLRFDEANCEPPNPGSDCPTLY